MGKNPYKMTREDLIEEIYKLRGGLKMNKVDTKKIVEWIEKNPSDLCEKSAAPMLNQLEIKSEMKTRPHKFKCGADGEVVEEITLKIKHTEGFNVQPHSSYEETTVDFMLRSYLNSQLQPWLENIDES